MSTDIICSSNPLHIIREFERFAFLSPIPVEEQPQPEIEQDSDGWQLARIGEERLPVMTADFPLLLIQPGHIARNKELAAHFGEFVIEGLQDYAREFRLLPLTIVRQGLRFFADYDDGTNEAKNLLCYSLDGLTPSPRVTSPMSPVCSRVAFRAGRPYRVYVCSHAVWRSDKPSCRSEVTVAFFDMNRKIPLRLQLKGLGMSAWNALQREYKRAGNIAKLRGLSIADFSIRLTAESRGSFMTPAFSMQYDESRPSRYLPLLRLYLDLLYPLRLSEAAEAESDGPEAATVEGGPDWPGDAPVTAEAATEVPQ